MTGRPDVRARLIELGWKEDGRGRLRNGHVRWQDHESLASVITGPNASGIVSTAQLGPDVPAEAIVAMCVAWAPPLAPVLDETALEGAVEALSVYGGERDWQKMRPDEMARIAVDAYLRGLRS